MYNKWKNGALPAVLLHGSIGSVYAWSLFVPHIAKLFNKPTNAIQFAFSLAIFFLGMSAAFMGKTVEKDIHESSLISCLFFCGGLIITAWAIQRQSLLMLYLGYGCSMGMGLGIGYITPVKTLMLWFKENKGFATGLSVCAFGFASSIASPIITFLINRFNLPIVFMILSFIYFVPMMIAHLLLYKPSDWKEPETDFSLTQLDKNFIFIWIIVFININNGLAVIGTASSILNELNIKASLIALIVSIMGIFNGAGRLVFSTYSDKLKRRKDIYLVILGLSIIVAVSSLFIHKFTLIALIIISACYGAGFSCLPSLLSDIYGMKNISKIHGLSLTAWAIAGLTGNQMAVLIKNISGSYINVFVVTCILYFIAFMIVNLVKKGE